MKIKYITTEDARGSEINKLIETRFPSLISENHPDLIFLTGGDGALLHAIQQYNHLQVPFLGHASGTLNFLMNKIDNVPEFLTGLLDNSISLHTLETTSIKLTIARKDGSKTEPVYGVNEVVIGTSVMGFHQLYLDLEDGSFRDFEIKGSGVCVATDLGSTGYNFNLEGSIIPLGSGLWAIKGIVCNRYLNDIVAIQKIQIQAASREGPVKVYVDGMESGLSINKEDKLFLEKGQQIRLAFLNKAEFIRRRTEIASRYRKV